MPASWRRRVALRVCAARPAQTAPATIPAGKEHGPEGDHGSQSDHDANAEQDRVLLDEGAAIDHAVILSLDIDSSPTIR